MRLADLASNRPTPFELLPSAAERQAIAAHLGITGIKKLRFEGAMTPRGKSDWSLTARLGATVVQDCVVTLNPVTTRIDEDIALSYVADMPEIDAAEIEMPVEDTVEPLPDSLDLVQVMIEALSLALPAYPRADDADLGEAVFAAKGVSPMKDEDAKPFAGLAGLREALEKKDK